MIAIIKVVILIKSRQANEYYVKQQGKIRKLYLRSLVSASFCFLRYRPVSVASRLDSNLIDHTVHE